MIKISKILLLLCVICLFRDISNAQNDAFFYKNYEQRSEEDMMGFVFGNFNNETNGFDFGQFSTDEFGFNFGDFSDEENGFNFGEFDLEDVDASLGNGLLMLSGLAFVRLRIKKRK